MKKTTTALLLFMLLIIFLTFTAKSQAVTARCSSDEIHCPGTTETCIFLSDQCNGFVDCPDGSDETAQLCLKLPCRISYGLEGFFNSNTGLQIEGLGTEGDHPTDAFHSSVNLVTPPLVLLRISYGLEGFFNSNTGLQIEGLGTEGDHPTDAFRCSYGGCISHVFRCNGIKNCADGSDETVEECGNNRCPTGHYRCSYGACVRRTRSCNGRRDCWDGSDETEDACRSRRRVCHPRRQGKCDYGACYDKRKKCDGRMDCIDGSDESPELCGETGITLPAIPKPTPKPTPPPTPKPTPKPTPPPPVVPPPAAPVIVEPVVPPFLFPGSGPGSAPFDCPASSCQCPFEGQEHICLPCQELRDLNHTCINLERPDVCSIQVSADVAVDVLTCGAQDYMFFGGLQRIGASCVTGNMRVPALTVVYADCWGTATFLMRCHSDGYWRPYGEAATSTASESSYAEQQATTHLCQPLQINSPVCGRRPRFKYTANNLGVFYDSISNRWPWLAGLKKWGRYECSATFINPLYLLTAAHCVARSPESWNETMDTRELRIQLTSDRRLDLHVSSITLHPSYKPAKRPQNDLALIKLDRAKHFSRNFFPACVDLDSYGFLSSSHAVTFDRSNGQSSYKYRELLQQLDPGCHSPLDRCYKLAITNTQFCGLDLDGKKSLAGGSSGGPYLQNLGTEGQEEWAVSGVVSSHAQQESCALPHTIFTSVGSYKTWILDTVHNNL